MVEKFLSEDAGRSYEGGWSKLFPAIGKYLKINCSSSLVKLKQPLFVGGSRGMGGHHN